MYADDTVLLSLSLSGLQSLLVAFQSLVLALNLVVNLEQAKSAILVFHKAGRKPRDVHRTITTALGVIHVASQYTHLGTLFIDTLKWRLASAARLCQAQTQADTLCLGLKAQHINNMWATALLFNAKVLQTLNFGIQIWGQHLLTQSSWLDNSHQSLMSKFFKNALSLPASTAHIIILLESGLWPMLMYGVVRVWEFRSNLPKVDSPALEAVLAYAGQDSFLSFCEQLQSRVPALAHMPAKDAMSGAILAALQVLKVDPRNPLAPRRKIATYLSWIWDESLHSRPAFYSVHLPWNIYRICLHARIQLISLPVHCLRHPYPLRLCHLCNMAVGDLHHVLLECPHLQLSRTCYLSSVGLQHASLQTLFRSASPLVWTFIANLLKEYMDVQ
jgi:hypothetical protein